MRNDALFGVIRRGFDPQRILAMLMNQEGKSDQLKRRVDISKRVWEVVFERIRTRVDPRLPSRLNCNFTFPEPHLAAWFRLRYSSEAERSIYAALSTGRWANLEMNLAHCGELHQGELSLRRVQDALIACEDRARDYWTGVRLDKGIPEVLVDGKVEIEGELLEPVAPDYKLTPVPCSEHYDSAEPIVFRRGDEFVADVSVCRRDNRYIVHATEVCGSSPEEAAQQATAQATVWALGQAAPADWKVAHAPE
jgi:hypothetical protein